MIEPRGTDRIRKFFERGRFLRAAGAVMLALAAVAGLAGLPGTAAERAGWTGAWERSPRLNPFVHFEQGSALFVGVDGRPAKYVRSGTIFPLGVGLANHSMESLSFDTESFVLETADGRRYQPIDRAELERGYSGSRADQLLSDAFVQIMTLRHLNYNFAAWRPFPYSGENVNPQSQIELGRRQWTHTMLYFPIPEDGLHGEDFNLLVTAREFEEPFVIGFSIR